MKVLVIEDNSEIQLIFEYLLKEEGYDVISCIDGCSIEYIKTQNPDLILLDELLPSVKGSDLCKELKADDGTRHIPVVIISAVADVNNIAEECGADGFVEKPFNIDSFTSVIKGLIG